MKVIVIGAGISGLATAHALVERGQKYGQNVDVTVLEAAPTVGGTIQTRSVEGFVCEGGPNGFLDAKPHTLALAKAVGLEDQLLFSSDAARRRFVMKNGKLLSLPTSPGAFLGSSLLSIGGRFRVIRERWVRQGDPDIDETVAEFAQRRLGAEAAERLIDPFVSGVFAGDPTQLSLKATFPRLAELEAEYGSLIKASAKLKRQRGRSTGDAAGPGGRLTTIRSGLSGLCRAIADSLPCPVRTDSCVQRIERMEQSWSVFTADAQHTDIDAVVFSTPAPVTARLLEPIDSSIAVPLRAIPYASVAVVALGFHRSQVAHSLDGFGFLIPHVEQRPILGCLWTSSIFPGDRAPEDHVLLRTMVGGARAGHRVEMDDASLLALVRTELDPLLGMTGDPVMVDIRRYQPAIPQYTLGHLDRVQALESTLAGYPGLVVTGNALRGVGINDCTREAERVAERLLGPVG